MRCYGTAPGSFLLFDDDGETLAYEREEYRWRRLESHTAADGGLRGTISEVEQEWRIIEPILERWASDLQGPEIYESGSQGPGEANRLLAIRGRAWRQI